MKLKCKICGGRFDHLGSHIWHKHKITAREYKTEFELPYKMSLISDKIWKKKHDAFEKDKEKYLMNLSKGGTKHRFKKGRTGVRRMSQYEKKANLKRIVDFNKKRKPGKCPVCRMVFDHVESHLANKHKLLRIK